MPSASFVPEMNFSMGFVNVKDKNTDKISVTKDFKKDIKVMADPECFKCFFTRR